MNIASILADLRIERERIDQAIAALEDLSDNGRRRGRAGTGNAGSPRRRISATGRARIAAAQRARWAKQKRASHPQPKATTVPEKGRGGRISAAGRKRLSKMMKKRWAKRKKQQVV